MLARSARLLAVAPRLPAPRPNSTADKRPPARAQAQVGGLWSHYFTLAAMFVYLGKIADIVPALTALHLGKILIAFAVLALMFEGGGRLKGLMQDRLWRPFVGILVLIVLTLPFGVWPGNTVTFILQTFFKELIFILLVIATTRSADDVRRLAWTFALNALVLDYALFRLGVIEIEKISLDRNEVAMISAMGIGLILAIKTGTLGTLMKVAMSAIMVAAILFSNSRGGYLGLAVVFASLLYFRLGGKVALSAVAILALGAIVYIQLPSYVKGRVDSIINYEQDYNLAAPEGRIEIWKRGLTMIKNDPLTGVGMRNFPIAEGMMHANVRGQPWMNAHNSPLQVAAEIGIAGLVLYLMLLTRMYRTAKTLRNQDEDPQLRFLGRGLTHAWVAYVVCGFFLSQGFAPAFYLLMAVTLAAGRIDIEPATATTPSGVMQKKSYRRGHVLHSKNP